MLLLRQLRERRGWSWSDLARALSDTARRLGVTSLAYVHLASIKRTVARWESASDDTVPGERYQFLLAHIYARTATGIFAFGPGSEFDILLTALHQLGVSHQRLEHLQALANQAVSEGGGLTALLSHYVHLDKVVREARCLPPGSTPPGPGAPSRRPTRRPVRGADKVARFVLGLLERYSPERLSAARLVLVNGDLGMVIPP